jgi:glycosyltransferase involved in cell wall biosynthesis
MVGQLDDRQLTWLYRNCRAVIAPSYEDFGLVPIEAAAFGKPTVALASGGFLDTVIDDVTGVLFQSPEPHNLAAAIRRCLATEFSLDVLATHREKFSEARFIARLRELAAVNANQVPESDHVIPRSPSPQAS